MKKRHMALIFVAIYPVVDFVLNRARDWALSLT